MKRLVILLLAAMIATAGHVKADEKDDVAAVVTSLRNIDPHNMVARVDFADETTEYVFLHTVIRQHTKQSDGTYKMTESHSLTVLVAELGEGGVSAIMFDENAKGRIDRAILKNGSLDERVQKKFVRLTERCDFRSNFCSPTGADFALYWQERYREALQAYLEQP